MNDRIFETEHGVWIRQSAVSGGITVSSFFETEAAARKGIGCYHVMTIYPESYSC